MGATVVCPFRTYGGAACGGELTVDRDGSAWRARCERCGASGPLRAGRGNAISAMEEIVAIECVTGGVSAMNATQDSRDQCAGPVDEKVAGRASGFSGADVGRIVEELLSSRPGSQLLSVTTDAGKPEWGPLGQHGQIKPGHYDVAIRLEVQVDPRLHPELLENRAREAVSDLEGLRDSLMKSVEQVNEALRALGATP